MNTLEELADAISCQLPMTPGNLTSTMNRADHPVGAYLRELTRCGVKALPAPAHGELLVPADVLDPAEHGTIGTAFGWWIRLRLYGNDAPLFEAQAARGFLPPHVQDALWELDTWIADRTRLDEPGDRERVAVVLAWCEQLFRAGPAVLPSSPLLELPPGSRAAEVLDRVPDRLVDQLARLGALADDRLLQLTQPNRAVICGPALGRPPIRADADLVIDETLLELKCTKGVTRTGELRFALRSPLVRQLVGYLLLDTDGRLATRALGVYAARFGLLWRMDSDRLLSAVSGRNVTVAQARAGFARLWHTV